MPSASPQRAAARRETPSHPIVARKHPAMNPCMHSVGKYHLARYCAHESTVADVLGDGRVVAYYCTRHAADVQHNPVVVEVPHV